MKEKSCLHCGSHDFDEKNEYSYCRFCGSKYIKRPEDQEVLLATAYQDLRAMRFLEAETKFEDIIQRYPRLPEAYWGCVCAKYGIKFEQDVSGKQIPTCCLPSIESFLNDAHFKKASNYSDMETSDWYRRQGEYIERVRKTWLENAAKTEAYDIFISYKDSDKAKGLDRTDDSIDAQELYIHLRDLGYRVFYSRESLRGVIGEKYEPYIFHALNTAKVMIVFGSSLEYINSTWLKNEWQRYQMKMTQGQKKQGSLIVIYNGFNPGDLPSVLRSVQALDWNSRSCFQDLDQRLKNFVRTAEEERRLEAEAKKAKAEAERKEREEAERQKREAEEKKKAEAKAAKARAAAEQKQRKRQYRLQHKKETQKTVKTVLSILITLVLLVGAGICSVLFEAARPWIIAGAIGVVYLVFWLLIRLKTDFTYIWLYMTTHILMSLAVIPLMIFEQTRSYAICFAGAVLASSVIHWIIDFDDEDAAEYWVPFTFATISGILLVITVSLFFTGYTAALILGIGVACFYCAYTIFGSIANDSFKPGGLAINIVVAVVGIVFICLSRSFAFYAMFILLATTVAAPFILYDFDGCDFDTIWYFFLWALALLTACLIFFLAWGISDYSIKDGVLTKYNGSEAVVEIPDGVVEIGEGAFRRSRTAKSMQKVIMPDSVTVIGDYAFTDCAKLKEVVFSNNLKTIGIYAFLRSGVQEIALPNSVTDIGSNCFDYCSSLTTVYLGSGLEKIGNTLFRGTNLRKLYYNGTQEEWDAIHKEVYTFFGAHQEWDYQADNFEMICEPDPNYGLTADNTVHISIEDYGCASVLKGSGSFAVLLALLPAALVLKKRRKKEA